MDKQTQGDRKTKGQKKLSEPNSTWKQAGIAILFQEKQTLREEILLKTEVSCLMVK